VRRLNLWPTYCGGNPTLDVALCSDN